MPNEFRPVDLKSVLMKIIESRVRSEIFKMTESLFDPMQFTCRYKGGYKYRRGVEEVHFLTIWRGSGLMQDFYL